MAIGCFMSKESREHSALFSISKNTATNFAIFRKVERPLLPLLNPTFPKPSCPSQGFFDTILRKQRRKVQVAVLPSVGDCETKRVEHLWPPCQWGVGLHTPFDKRGLFCPYHLAAKSLTEVHAPFVSGTVVFISLPDTFSLTRRCRVVGGVGMESAHQRLRLQWRSPRLGWRRSRLVKMLSGRQGDRSVFSVGASWPQQGELAEKRTSPRGGRPAVTGCCSSRDRLSS